VTLVTESGTIEDYDHVILATHSDTSLKILSAGGLVTPLENSILSGFSWTKNEAVLHSETEVGLVPENFCLI
jgi:predicted NAD/FAD-binding protein